MKTEERRTEFAMFHKYWYARQQSLHALWFLQSGHEAKLVNHHVREFFGDLLTKDCTEFPVPIRQAILRDNRILIYDVLDKLKRIMDAPSSSRKYAGDATLREVITAGISESAGRFKMLQVYGISSPVDGVIPFWRNPINNIHGLADQLLAIYERDMAPDTEEDENNRLDILNVVSAYLQDDKTDLISLVGARMYSNQKWIATTVNSNISADDYLKVYKVLDNYRLIRRDDHPR